MKIQKAFNLRTLILGSALVIGTIGLSSFIASEKEGETTGNTACEVYGKIKIVDYGEDYKVKKVDYGEDVKVKWVDYGEDDQGEWKEVDYGEDFKIKWVDYGEDFKVKFVDYGEGC
ncbi:MAG: hypothetical protein WDZ35_08295 [Crocinitomicaceae bacterium]